MTRAKVAAVKVTPETVLAGIARACELGAMPAALAQGRTTLLREELPWRFPFPSSCTTPWQLEGAILALRAAGFSDLVAARSDTAALRLLEGADPNHGAPLLAKYGVPIVRTYREADVRWVEYRPKARMRALGKAFPDGIRVPDAFFGKNVVHLPTMKCHVYATVAGAMKTAFGGMLPRDRHRAHPWIHQALVDVLAIQREIHAGVFAIMDGTTAGDGAGPRALTPVVKDYVLAGADQVALDAVAAKMMGFDPMSIDYIRLAHEDKLGVGDPRDIEVVGSPDAAHESWGFRVEQTAASAVGELLWKGSLRPLRRLVFGTPAGTALALGSEAYHDLYRWPLKDRRTFENWRRETAWGRLMSAYERGEADRITRRPPPIEVPAHNGATQAHL